MIRNSGNRISGRSCSSKCDREPAMAVQSSQRIASKLHPFLSCLFAAAAGIGMSVAAAALTASRESRHAEAQFNVVAENHYMVVQNGLNEYVNRLRAMRALF